MKAIRVEKIFENGNEAFVRYEAELTTGEKFRNTEIFRIEGGKVKEVQVYYGAKTGISARSQATSPNAGRRSVISTR